MPGLNGGFAKSILAAIAIGSFSMSLSAVGQNHLRFISSAASLAINNKFSVPG